MVNRCLFGDAFGDPFRDDLGDTLGDTIKNASEKTLFDGDDGDDACAISIKFPKRKIEDIRYKD